MKQPTRELSSFDQRTNTSLPPPDPRHLPIHNETSRRLCFDVGPLFGLVLLCDLHKVDIVHRKDRPKFVLAETQWSRAEAERKEVDLACRVQVALVKIFPELLHS
jgi:hypothetical protein